MAGKPKRRLSKRDRPAMRSRATVAEATEGKSPAADRLKQIGTNAFEYRPPPGVPDLPGAHANAQLFGGSRFDVFNNMVLGQALNSFRISTEERNDKAKMVGYFDTAVLAMAGIAPKDETEGMLGAQMIACHNATMECYRRAALPEQTFEGRQQNLAHAGKLSRTYAQLLESLDRHRGKGGQQKVTVEHVHVHAGGQAIVGNIEPPGGGGGGQPRVPAQSHAQLPAPTDAPLAPMRSQDEKRPTLRVASDAERPVPDARRT